MTNLRGYFTALVTPMRADGSIDIPAFERLVDWQIEQGIHGIVPCGTTGESPALREHEQRLLFRKAVNVANKRVPVIAGAGANSTHEAITLTKIAQEEGADAVLQVVPYYNKPSQRGIFEHFKAVHESSDIDIVLYNVPSRTIVSLGLETQERLAELPRIIGVKDATGDLSRVERTTESCGDNFVQLTGEDENILDFLRLGGHGAISVTSNIAPGLCAQLFSAHTRGDRELADELHAQLMPVHKAMFYKPAPEDESSPAQVTFAGSTMGLWEPHMRLPMTPVIPEVEQVIRDALKNLNRVSGRVRNLRVDA